MNEASELIPLAISVIGLLVSVGIAINVEIMNRDISAKHKIMMNNLAIIAEQQKAIRELPEKAND